MQVPSGNSLKQQRLNALLRCRRQLCMQHSLIQACSGACSLIIVHLNTRGHSKLFSRCFPAEGSLDSSAGLASVACLQPDWWQRSNSAGAERAAANGVADSPSDSDAAPQQEEPRAAGGQQRPQANGGPGPRRSVVGPSEAGSWTAPVVGGVRRPGARYEHAVALLDGRMFVVGGNCGEAPAVDPCVPC